MEYNENILDENLINEKETITDAYRANGGKRFANLLIDSIIINFLYFGLLYVLDVASDYETLFLISYPMQLLYYWIMEYYYGKTIGKMVTKTKVVDINGNRPSSSMAFTRSICRFIPFNALSFLGTPPRGWHDTIAKSFVVRDEDVTW
ncbi:MAG: RDD family protein [Saprospiraceae bacterium]|nr:RDD family protein [Saprospiraceae bacterium]